jgi:hypothetical protein
MGTVDSEHLKFIAVQTPDPTGNVPGFSVPRTYERIAVRRQPGLILRKASERPERDPRLPGYAPHRGEEEPDNRYREQRGGNDVQGDAELQ